MSYPAYSVAKTSVWPVYSAHCMSGMSHLELLYENESAASAYVAKRMKKLTRHEKAIDFRVFVGKPMRVYR